MKAIVVSVKEFLVDAREVRAQIGGNIVSIDTKETETTSTYHGGYNENVPAYGFLKEEDWLKASKEFGIIELESKPELLALYNKVHNAHEDQFESESDFVESHHYFPVNRN